MDIPAVLESLLFIHGEPVAEKKIARILEISVKDVAEGLAELQKRLAGRGIALIEKDGEWQMVSHPDHARFVDALIKEQYTEELSRAALETLAIIAYKGPMTRAEIEYIRGVNSSFSLRSLLLRGLVERTTSEADARSFVYGVGFDFLKYLGLARREDLPEYEALRKEAAGEPPQEPSAQVANAS